MRAANVEVLASPPTHSSTLDQAGPHVLCRERNVFVVATVAGQHARFPGSSQQVHTWIFVGAPSAASIEQVQLARDSVTKDHLNCATSPRIARKFFTKYQAGTTTKRTAWLQHPCFLYFSAAGDTLYASELGGHQFY